MKRRKKLITAILSAVLIFCINFMPKVYGKYQHSVKDEDAFVIEFPIQNISAVVAETLAGKFGNILNSVDDADSYNTLITAMEESSENANETYIGNVAGENVPADTKVIRELFGLKENENIMYGNAPVTVMIKRENLDNNSLTGGQEKIEIFNLDKWSYETIVGWEMTIYTTSENPSANTVSKNWLGETVYSDYETIDVYAMVFSKCIIKDDSGELKDTGWRLIGQYKGEATSNNYSGDRDGEPNSFNTDTWVPTEEYYKDAEKTEKVEKIENVTWLSSLVRYEYRAQANLAALKAGTDLPYTDFT